MKINPKNYLPNNIYFATIIHPLNKLQLKVLEVESVRIGGIRVGSYSSHPHPHDHLYDLHRVHALQTHHLVRHGLWPMCSPHSPWHARSPMPLDLTLRPNPAYSLGGCTLGKPVRTAIVIPHWTQLAK